LTPGFSLAAGITVCNGSRWHSDRALEKVPKAIRLKYRDWEGQIGRVNCYSHCLYPCNDPGNNIVDDHHHGIRNPSSSHATLRPIWLLRIVFPWETNKKKDWLRFLESSWCVNMNSRRTIIHSRFCSAPPGKRWVQIASTFLLHPKYQSPVSWLLPPVTSKDAVSNSEAINLKNCVMMMGISRTYMTDSNQDLKVYGE
jgi:hypothetical protein